ncbi:MAG: LCP family protein [Clostridiales bacterium]|nr:LCP family protein [Clostridiales bacterium]
MKGFREKVALVILLALVVIAVAMLALLMVLRSGEPDEDAVSTESAAESETDEYEEILVSYNGKHYRYNEDLSVYLLLGIDKDGVVEEAEDYISGGQSDALFLLVADESSEELSIVSIQRNTMTDVDVYSEDGRYMITSTLQICLQHGYGDGMEISCEYSVNAVSRLFYNIEIDGYLSLNMGGIPALNDAVGGVTVEVLQDMDYSDVGVSLTAGETVTLNGTEAYYYMRGRDTSVFDSASDRLRRQEQYIAAFFEQLKVTVGNDAFAMLDIYESVEDYMVTDMDVAGVLSELAEYEYSADRLYTVPGETVKGEEFEEYYVDEDAFYEMCLDIFYVEVEE